MPESLPPPTPKTQKVRNSPTTGRGFGGWAAEKTATHLLVVAVSGICFFFDLSGILKNRQMRCLNATKDYGKSVETAHVRVRILTEKNFFSNNLTVFQATEIHSIKWIIV